MVIGEKKRLWVPAILAYALDNQPGKPKGNVIFDIELVAIYPIPPAPAATPPLRAPADADGSGSGLRWQILQRGYGSRSPHPGNRVLVHYQGWNSKGDVFDSSWLRGEPTWLSVDAVIKGWQEGIPMMIEGETRRFFIPAELAYGREQKPGGPPAGDLVFEVSLLGID